MYTFEEVYGRRVKYKSGNTGRVVGGMRNAILTEWNNGNITGFGHVDDIVSIEADDDGIGNKAKTFLRNGESAAFGCYVSAIPKSASEPSGC